MPHHWAAVLAGGLSHERDVSLRSGRRVAAALRSAGLAVEEWDVDSSLIDKLSKHRPDAVVVALHGGEGENGSVQAVLEMLDIPFVGADPHSCRRAWDKPTTKALLSDHGIETPDWIALPHSTFRELGAQAVLDGIVRRYGLPLLLKPAQGGSALGVAVVRDAADLPAAMVGCFGYADTVLVERLVTGTEVAVSVVARDEGLEALPAVEIVPDGGVYDYTARYTAGLTEFHTPARLSAKAESAVTELAVTVHRLLGLRDLSRTDAIVTADDTVQFLEVNVSPGLTETSLMPMAIEAAGSGLGDVFAGLIERAVHRANRT